MINCAIPPNNVPQKPVRFPASSAANQKMTGITTLIKVVAAGTNTATAVTCKASGIAAAVEFKMQQQELRQQHQQSPFS